MTTDVLNGSVPVDAPIGDDVAYEIVDGLRVKLPPMSAQELCLANVLAGMIWYSLTSNRIGQPFVEMLFRLRREPKLDRRPDVAFVSYARWADRIIPTTDAWEMIPALAVEVVSKTNTVWEIQKKVGDYFRHSVELVWVIHPEQRTVHVYTSRKKIEVLDENDILTGGAVLPDFQVPVSKLFESLAPASGL